MSLMKTVAPYGSWPSAVTSEFLTLGNCKAICELQVHKGAPFWVEQTFPAGVRVLFERRADKSVVQWSPDDVSVTNSVYEYGGGSFCVLGGATNAKNAATVVVSTRGGALLLLTAPKSGRPLTSNAAGEDVRYADLFPHNNYVFAVQERHNVADHDAEPINCIARLCVNTGDLKIVAQGADFYAEPRVSLDGRFLVWMQWSKPNMPWDKTSIWIAELSVADATVSGEPRQLVGDDACYFAPQWSTDESGEAQLFANADPTGYWNVYELDVGKGGLKKNVCPLEMDLANALWNLADDRAYAVNAGHMTLALDHTNPVIWHRRRRGFDDAVDQFRPIESLRGAGFTVFAFLTLSADRLFAIAAGPKRSCSLVEVDLETYEVNVVRETRSLSELERLPLSAPQLHTFESDGVKVDGYYYPPTSFTHCDEAGKPPPVVFVAHPGPTMRTTEALDLKKQYYTTRGFAVFDVNYRGSTGYGTEFRNRLNGQWGVVDAADMINGAKYLVERRLADPERLCIAGSSAGGYLVFSVLMHPENPFHVGASTYGVMDLLDLLKSTHKFEADYNVQLVAPYPESIDMYRQRSAIYNLDKVNVPVAFFHGTDDPVVDVSQSKNGFEKLREKGIPTFIKLFEGEGHGFRSKQAITQTLDMTYVFFCRVLGIQPSVDVEMEISNLPNAN